MPNRRSRKGARDLFRTFRNHAGVTLTNKETGMADLTNVAYFTAKPGRSR